MYGDVAKSDHVTHGFCGFRGDFGGVFEQGEGIAARLGDAEAKFGDVMHCEIDGGFAGAQ